MIAMLSPVRTKPRIIFCVALMPRPFLSSVLNSHTLTGTRATMNHALNAWIASAGAGTPNRVQSMYASAKKIHVLADWSKMAQKNMTVRNSSPIRLSVSIFSLKSARFSSGVTTWYTTGRPVTVLPWGSGLDGSPTTFLVIVSRA